MTDAEHEAPPDARPDPDRGNDDAPGPTELPIVRTRWEVIPPFRTLAVEDTITAWGFTGDDFVTGRQSWLDRIHPDDYDQEVARLAQDIDAAQSHPVSYTTYRFQLADGRWQRLASINVFEFDRTGRAVVASTLLNPDPRAVSAVLAMRADDGQRRADSDRLAAILRFASDPIVLTDAFGRPTWANGAFGRLGLTFEDLQQRLMCDALVANAVNAGTLEGLGTALATGQPYRGDLQFVLDPHPVLMEVDCVPLRVPEGRVSGFMMTLRDVTATRAAAATLAEREAQVRDVERLEAMGRLAAGVAHDFGNLLQLIGGSLEMLDRGLHTDDPLRRHASTARGAV
ncbi:MAG: PAS domain-containing protein [Gemmatimonadaceae bacterium]|jgi:PAS domain-containing protein|nr:PAS domain-containing protein [Gemmatimonadaceae bacterium]